MYLEEKIDKILQDQTKLLKLMEDNIMRSDNKLKVYTLNEVAEIFNVTIRTIYNWKDQGILPFTIIGSKTYVTELQLLQLLDENEVTIEKKIRIDKHDRFK